MDYLSMRSFLDDNNVTHEEMDEGWNKLRETNIVVQNLAEHGQTWVDLPMHLLADMVRKMKEQL